MSRRYDQGSTSQSRQLASREVKRALTTPASSLPTKSQFRRLCIAAHNRNNWLFTWLDEGGERTGDILSIVATCIAHDVNPRAYLHRVVHRIVHGWPQAKLRDLLPDRMLAEHPELYIGDPDALPMPPVPRVLAP